MKLLTLDGKEVINLFDEAVGPGKHTLNFPYSEISSGVYILNTSIGNVNESYKILKR